MVNVDKCMQYMDPMDVFFFFFQASELDEASKSKVQFLFVFFEYLGTPVKMNFEIE